MRLTAQERVTLTGMLEEFRGNMVTVKAFQRFSNRVLAFSDKEIEDFDIVAHELPTGGTHYQWSPEKTKAFGPDALSVEVDIPKRLLEAIQQVFQKLEEKELLGAREMPIYDKFFADQVDELEDQAELMLKPDKNKTE